MIDDGVKLGTIDKRFDKKLLKCERALKRIILSKITF